MTYALGALAGVVVLQTIWLWRMAARLRGVARLDERLSHFAEALALLTDTTEAGLANVAAELDKSGRRRSPRASARNPTTKRIATAMRHGRSVGQIAAAEDISESEIRLHLELGGDTLDKDDRHATLRI